MRQLFSLWIIASFMCFMIGCGGGDAETTIASNSDGTGGAASDSSGSDYGTDYSDTGGDEYGGDEYGGDEYGGDEYGGDEYGGDEYGGDEYGSEYGSDEEMSDADAYGDEYDDYGSEYGTDGEPSDEDMYGDEYDDYGSEYGADGEPSGEDMYGDEYDEYGAEYGTDGEPSDEDMYGDEYDDYGSEYGDGMEDGTEEDPYGDGAYGEDPYGGGGNRKPKTLAEQAQLSFRRGADRDAFQYLYAHAVAADAGAATEVLEQIVLSSTLKGPTLGVRWGLGVELTPAKYQGNAFPIGTKQNIPQRAPTTRRPSRRGGSQGGYGAEDAAGGYDSGAGYADGGYDQGGYGEGGYGEGGYDEGGYGGGGGPSIDPTLKRLAGELAEKIVDGLKTRSARGDYGKALQSLAADKASSNAGGAGGTEEFGYGSEGEDYGAGYGVDDYGVDDNGAGAGGAADDGTSGGRQVMPGVVFIGQGDQKALLVNARNADVDAMIVFSVALGMNPRNGLILNNTTVRLYNARTGKKTAETKKLNNIEIQQDRQKEEEIDVVAREVEKLFKEIDIQWKVTEMPTLPPESVKARIGILLNPVPENPLPALAEIRMYHVQGTLDDQLLTLAYQRMLGQQLGTILAQGAEAERKQVIQQWLPGQKAASDEGTAEQ